MTYRHRITDPVTLKISGDPHKVTALINLLNKAFGDHDLSDLCIEPYSHGRKDGLREQTAYLDIEPQRHYATNAERTRPEYPGYVYLVLGLETGRLKIGETDDMQRRLGELRREFGETCKRLHVIHTRDRFAKEKEIQDYLKLLGLHLEREFFKVPEPIEAWFISQPNEF